MFPVWRSLGAIEYYPEFLQRQFVKIEAENSFSTIYRQQYQQCGNIYDTVSYNTISYKFA